MSAVKVSAPQWRGVLGVLALLMGSAYAALSPASGTITEANRNLQYTGGPIVVSDPQGVCPSQQVCEDFPLTVTLPANYQTQFPNDTLRIEMNFQPASDMILTVLNSAGAVIASSDNGVGQPELVSIPALNGTNTYKIRAAVFAGAVSSYTTKVNLIRVIGDAAATGIPPRFAHTVATGTLGANAGEPSVGYNSKTKRAMVIGGLETLRVTFPENQSDALNPNGLPESCDATWENRSGTINNKTTLDPILYVDYALGRTLSGQLAPKSQLMEYSDDDGQTWQPSQGNPTGTAGVDHQTIVSGPYPNPLPTGVTRLTAYQNAVYYCGQDIVYANCGRSDDGGRTFGPAVIVTNTTQCGGLHGHLRVAPDGTVYLPNKNCGANQGIAVSTDAGLNWVLRTIPDSTTGSNDPQFALATDGTGYFCYVGADGRPRASVTKDKGRTWSASVNLGDQVGIKKAVFPQGIAGDPDRAACAFIATNTEGNSEALDFPGIWYAYMSVTYDGGQTWKTISVNPTDPAQGAGGVCTSGTTCGANRNLLDFNEMAIDEKGRAIFVYADGCVGNCSNNPNTVSRSEKATITRLMGGRTLYKQFDVPEPYISRGACLSGNRNTARSALTWKLPVDDGASGITGYRIYRSTTPTGSYAFVGNTGPKNTFEDLTQDPAVPVYYYKVTAINGVGEGVFSNIIQLPLGTAPVIANICTAPGIDLLTDPAGDVTADPAAAQPFYDLEKLSISQPFTTKDSIKVLVTLKIRSLSTLPPSSAWFTSFLAPDGKTYGVRMTTSAANAIVYESYEVTADNNGVKGGQFGTAFKVAEAASAYSTNGTIAILVKASNIGLVENGDPDQVLKDFNAGVIQNATVNGVGGSSTKDSMPVTGRSGTLNVRNSLFCAPNTPPVPALAADTERGPKPLTVNFDATASFDNESFDRVAEYRFDFGDGTATVIQATPKVAHTYTETGRYGAKLTVVDSRGLESTAPADRIITVLDPPPTNRAPNASFTASKTSGRAPLQVDFDAVASTDPDTDDSVKTFIFDFGDGSPVVTQATATASHTYTAAGDYTATLKVKDTKDLDSANVASQVINVTANQAPTARLASDKTSGVKPLIVQFNAGTSSDADGDGIGEYRFDFGDGSPIVTQSTPTLSHTYNTEGNYTAKVSVRDGLGLASANDGALVINVTLPDAPPPANQVPIARLTTDKNNGFHRLTVLLDASTSSDPDGDTLATYEFDFGDGSPTVSQTSRTISHTYSAGSYNAKVKVTDNRGAVSAFSANVPITVKANQAPIAQLDSDGQRVTLGGSIRFSAARSVDPDRNDGDSIVSYTFDFGDGVVTSNNNPVIDHLYTQAGTYTVKLTIADAQGALGVDSRVIEILPQVQTPPEPPVVVLPDTKPLNVVRNVGRFGGGSLDLALLMLLGMVVVGRRRFW